MVLLVVPSERLWRIKGTLLASPAQQSSWRSAEPPLARREEGCVHFGACRNPGGLRRVFSVHEFWQGGPRPGTPDLHSSATCLPVAMNLQRFESAPTFADYLGSVEANRDLWTGLYDRVRLPEHLVEIARVCAGTWRMVALSEDWCGDAVNILPVVARFAQEVGWDLRVLGRDDNLDLMDAHLTDGRSQSIPVVIVYDEDFGEVGWWGPRPGELQRWVHTEGAALPKDDRYKEVRRWYAQDRGRTTIGELMDVFCHRI